MKELEELTVRYEHDGVVLVEELGKRIIRGGNWATVIFLFHELDKKHGGFRKPKVALRRYQKRRSGYELTAKFVLTSLEQAAEVAAVLDEWADGP